MDEFGGPGRTAGGDEIALLGGHALSALLSPPAWIGRGDPSAELLPLAGLLVRALRPRTLRALAGAGASFVAALAEAILAETGSAELLAALPRDPVHAAELQALFATRYRGIGRLFGEGLGAVPVAEDEVDLLVMDAATDWASGMPVRPSSRGVLVLRGTRRSGELWRAIAQARAAASLPLGEGVAIVAWGEATPPDALALISAIGREDADGVAMRRNLVRLGARLGETVPDAGRRDRNGGAQHNDVAEEGLRGRLAEALVARDRAQRALPLAAEREALAHKLARLERLEGERQVALGWLQRSTRQVAELAARAAAARAEVDRLEVLLRRCAEQAVRARALLESDPVPASGSWLGRARAAAASRPGSVAVAELAALLEQAHDDAARAAEAGSWGADATREPELAALLDPAKSTADDPPLAEAAWQRARRIRSVLFVAGESDQPGAELRTRRLASICARGGRTVRSLPLAEVGPDAIAGIDLLVLWRAAWSEHVATMIGLVRHAGGLVVFDVDDLVTEPSLARVELIDGMRTNAVAPLDLAHLFERFRQVAAAADACVATTEELAGWLRLINDRVLVVPNGFDDAAFDRGRIAVRRVAFERSGIADAVVRIGYAAGSVTHQRDFARAADGLARVLRERPATRLVLFRGLDGPTLRIEEFDGFAELSDRIEWRESVPLDRLPEEIARFDVAIAPLEIGNPFCEAKSELKLIDAAVCSVPCVASPTGPYARAIRHGETGMLAADALEWEACLSALVDDSELRTRIGRQAHADALWRFGPRRCGEMLGSMLEGLEGGAQGSARVELAIRRGAYDGFGTPEVPQTETLFEADRLAIVDVTVVVTSFNYARHVEEALDSVARQTLEALELIVVDDCSTDGSIALIVQWAGVNEARFGRIAVLRTLRNAGLGPARNAGYANAHARHVMVLDADNRLLPACCETLHRIVDVEDCAFAYSTLTQFGEATHDISALDFDPWRLIPGNCIDAMALVARWAWAAAGGYYDNPSARGWEDFDLWCRLVELGQRGVRHRAPLAEYRVHGDSMTNSVTEREDNKRHLVAFLEQRHPWLRLRSRVSALR